MSTARDIRHSGEVLGLKAAFRQLVESVGTLEFCAEIAGVGKSQISDYQMPNTDRFAPVQVVMALEAVSPAGPLVSAYLARRAGHVLVALPEARQTAADYLVAVGAILKGSGGLSAALLTAMADRRIDRSERAGLRGDIARLQAELAGLDFMVEAESG